MHRKPVSNNKGNLSASHTGHASVDSNKKGNANSNSDNKLSNMESKQQAHGDHFEGKEATPQEKRSAENRDERAQSSSGVVSSTQEDLVPIGIISKRSSIEGSQEVEPAEDESSKRKKKKDNEDKELMGKPAPVARSSTGRNKLPYIEDSQDAEVPDKKTSKKKKRKSAGKKRKGKPATEACSSSGRILTGSKPPGPASKTGATPLKSSANQGKVSGSSSSGKGGQSQGKGSGTGKAGSQSHQGKSGSAKGASSSHAGKQDKTSPILNVKQSHGKDNDDEDHKESTAPKVPPLKIVIPGGASGSGRNDQDGEGGSGQRGSGKGRGGSSTLPYVIPCTSTDTGHKSDSSDNCDDKRANESSKAGQRVLRSHRTHVGDKDKGRTSPTETRSRSNQALKFKSPSRSGHDAERSHSTSSGAGGRNEAGSSGDVHPRKRKLKSSRDSHKSDHKNDAHDNLPSVPHGNPYQLAIHIRNQIDQRQKSLFPVKPKPPKDFNKYLMNRCTYTLQSTVNPEPPVVVPHNMPPQMVDQFMEHENERTQLRIQHLVEKEKLVLSVEQEILRVHGRAERAVANQALPFSVCTILRDKEVYNVLAPEQEEKRNAQRSRCNGRQINSWLQEVDDKWEKIKESMLRRQHTEAEALHAVQRMLWEWKLQENGLCEFSHPPKIDPSHVPQIHVSNFDLRA